VTWGIGTNISTQLIDDEEEEESTRYPQIFV
jgi:hypothetical protein